jgi:hypothetical protein
VAERAELLNELELEEARHIASPPGKVFKV